MQIGENEAYAVAAWSRFDDEVTDELLRAVAGAFALIASADGEIVESEVDGLVTTVISTRTLPRIDAEQLENCFRDLGQALLTSVEDGRALDAIRAVAGDPRKAELVAHAAYYAMVADGRVHKPEQNALQELCRMLNVDPAALTA